MTFDPIAICKAFNDEGVEYVVLGGFAALIHGSSLPTRDIDVIPASSSENLERLGRALTRLNAQIRTSGEPVPVRIDGAFLSEMPHLLNLVTDLGEVDLTFSPSGSVGGYEGWLRSSVPQELSPGLVVRIASLDAIIDSKRAAGRPKDKSAIPYLESLKEQLGNQ